MEKEVLSLYELTTLVREVISYSFDDTYWIKAEIVRVNENASGHCYLELVEKSEHTDTIIAQCRAIIWRNIYSTIAAHFRNVTHRELETGMKILFRARVEFHQIYGFSLHITEIDPHFTLGEMVARKMQIIEQLKREGIFDMNRSLTFPLVPQRIAIISSKTAAGYNDFIRHLEENSLGYKFRIHLYQATMQGEKAEQSIIKALEKIFDKVDHYDVVVIIRGGGSQVDLSCFDNYQLASHIAQFPIPVLTGIGHEQDESIVDLIAYRALKTPTAVADFLIEVTMAFENQLDDYFSIVFQNLSQNLFEQKKYLDEVSRKVPYHLQQLLLKHTHQIQVLHSTVLEHSQKLIMQEDSKIRMVVLNVNYAVQRNIHFRSQQVQTYLYQSLSEARQRLLQQQNRLDFLHTKAELSNPAHILNKGYSITLFEGKPLLKANDVDDNAIIETLLYDGKLTSKVIKKNP
ncbi:MAG: exodeoxyribonuclease VII large subunit [Bacteroidales bacterium]|nr:exodeoxyribonuclease VII large subunit [Bacteroidales bacterium]